MRWPLLLLLPLLWLAACSTPRVGQVPPMPGGRDGRDGPEAVPPPHLLQVPDALPRVEPIRPGGPNKPYELDGQRYEPLVRDEPFKERGLASWYGKKFHGRPTANGEIYNMYAMTAAHKLLPLPSYVRVRNPANGREVVVRVNDRGPFAAGRVIDLSYTAALKLDLLRGVAPVEIERITFDDIRAGRWPSADEPVLYAPPAAEGAPPVTRTQDQRPPPDAASEARALGKGLWLQAGSFRTQAAAEDAKAELGLRLPELIRHLAVWPNNGQALLLLGPFPSREQAERVAQRLRNEAELEAVLLGR